MQHMRYLFTVASGRVISVAPFPGTDGDALERDPVTRTESLILAAVLGAELFTQAPLENIREIAKATGLRRSTVGDAVKRLVEAGRITKCPLGYIASEKDEPETAE